MPLKKLVQTAHSPLESDGTIRKSIIWSVISIRRFTWIRSLNYVARNLESCRGYCEKISGAQAWQCADQTLYFSAHTEKQLERTLVGWAIKRTYGIISTLYNLIHIRLTLCKKHRVLLSCDLEQQSVDAWQQSSELQSDKVETSLGRHQANLAICHTHQPLQTDQLPTPQHRTVHCLHQHTTIMYHVAICHSSQKSVALLFTIIADIVLVMFIWETGNWNCHSVYTT